MPPSPFFARAVRLFARFCFRVTESAGLSYIAAVLPICALVMATLAPFALFRPSNIASSAAAVSGGYVNDRGVVSQHAGSRPGGRRGEEAGPGDWTGPMLPFEVRSCGEVDIGF